MCLHLYHSSLLILCRSIEDLGPRHQLDICDKDCSAQHAFHTVRAQAYCAAIRQRGFVELKIDLHADLQLLSCKDLANLPVQQLQVCHSLQAPPILLICLLETSLSKRTCACIYAHVSFAQQMHPEPAQQGPALRLIDGHEE